MRFLIRSLFILAGVGIASLLLARLYTYAHAASRQYSIEEVPHRSVAIVFGAGLRRDGTPAAVLRERVITAAELYFAGKVDILLMSGDNRFEYYDEPTAMYNYARQLGVPEDAIVRDYAGHSTYDTCYRASAIFGVTEAIVVTQPFHIARALYLCNQFDINTIGVPASLYTYRESTLTIWNIRETLATLAALWNVHIARPLPVLGNPEPILQKTAFQEDL